MVAAPQAAEGPEGPLLPHSVPLSLGWAPLPGVPLSPTSAVREELIDKSTESAVSRMQSVIELGRVIRDRRTIPIKV